MAKFLPSGPEVVAGTVVLLVGLTVWELFGRDIAFTIKDAVSG